MFERIHLRQRHHIQKRSSHKEAQKGTKKEDDSTLYAARRRFCSFVLLCVFCGY
jgi:hypothetical protein